MSGRQIRSQSQQPQNEQQPSSSSGTKPLKISNNSDIIIALTAQIKAINTIFNNKFANLKKSNQVLTDKVTAFKRTPSPERRRRKLLPLVEIELKKKDTSILEKDHFRIKEIGYFDGTGNVYAFVDKLKTVSKIKSIKLVKNYLILYFMD